MKINNCTKCLRRTKPSNNEIVAPDDEEEGSLN
jgi:hypothetical protein